MSRPQPGITNRPPQHLVLAALNLQDPTPTGARTALDGLANVIERELRSDLDPPNENKDQPSAETGELGFDEGYDRGHLTITLGLASTMFDALGIAGPDRPSDIRPFPWDKFGLQPPAAGSGDLILQICSDDLFVCEHVVRRVEEELAASVRVAWSQLGTQRYTTRAGRTSREEGRALIGFLDGRSNLSPRNSVDDAALVFIDPDPAVIAGYPQNPSPDPGATGPYANTTTGPHFPELQPVPTSEPSWTKHGTYMTVRVSTFDTTPWDDLTQNQQAHAVGRFKVSGSSLDLVDDKAHLHADPAFQADQTITTVALNAHVRKANPRRSPEDLARRLYRRGYPIIASAAAGMQRGLAFIAFARTTSTQFEFIFRAWLQNADFPQQQSGPDQLLFSTLPDTVMYGGYYYVPAVERQPWTWIIGPLTSDRDTRADAGAPTSAWPSTSPESGGVGRLYSVEEPPRG